MGGWGWVGRGERVGVTDFCLFSFSKKKEKEGKKKKLADPGTQPTPQRWTDRIQAQPGLCSMDLAQSYSLGCGFGQRQGSRATPQKLLPQFSPGATHFTPANFKPFLKWLLSGQTSLEAP